MTFARELESALHQVIQQALPGHQLVAVVPFGTDVSEPVDGTAKGLGYGEPLKLIVEDAQGERKTLVFHTATPDIFGHDRRADRAAEMLLSYDTFAQISRHVQALDVGAIEKTGAGLVSLRNAGEFYLLTTYAPGHVYAEELRRVGRISETFEQDMLRCETLAQYLVGLHAKKYAAPARYVRALRDLVGSGEGIFGIADGYPPDVPAAPKSRLQSIERRALEWRFRLSNRVARLSRIHGDFHPFNVLFTDQGELSLLDASRGSMGEPADDVGCMAINYVFFALEKPELWRQGFAELWHRFWRTYLEQSNDYEVLEVVAPFLAWRGLVLASPVWYPALETNARDRLLSLVERALDSPSFDPSFAEVVFK